MSHSLFEIFSLLNEEWLWPPGIVRENSLRVPATKCRFLSFRG